MSLNFNYADESIEEAHKFFRTRIAYVRAGGGVAFSINTGTLKLTSLFMTGDPIKR